MDIVKLEKNHIDELVDVHIKAFPDFFLTFLGAKFLKEFYASFLTDSTGIAYVAVEDNRVYGGIVGPLIPDGFFKRLLMRRWYAFVFASISAVLRKPSVVSRLLRAVFYRGEAPNDGDTRSLLSSIAVSPDCQGKGVGAKLVKAWLKEAKERGSKGCFLTTDKCDNEAVNGFYQKTGWKLESSYKTPQGREMNRYVYDF